MGSIKKHMKRVEPRPRPKYSGPEKLQKIDFGGCPPSGINISEANMSYNGPSPRKVELRQKNEIEMVQPIKPWPTSSLPDFNLDKGFSVSL